MSVQDSSPASRVREIPTRRVLLNDISQLPGDYCTTPGGTLFSTTPGGTRIVYERSFLLKCRNSPLTKSPPTNMAKIPGITTMGEVEIAKENGLKTVDEKEKAANTLPAEDQPQFEMDI
ncbi:eukaryotic translation initiation factor 4E-binding protein 2-like [Gigantopelta aegis]|uniref:eukaryotic translation initiation factor 4E-binding protein 2-like n=1 Tax=Gigantopelta aegis TaxID=1735272 RepID=UPI001B88D5CE|nr:eukaryotic translation initiation factor 4E-binding protein 2-like [Gigantopelta aegis]